MKLGALQRWFALINLLRATRANGPAHLVNLAVLLVLLAGLIWSFLPDGASPHTQLSGAVAANRMRFPWLSDAAFAAPILLGCIGLNFFSARLGLIRALADRARDWLAAQPAAPLQRARGLRNALSLRYFLSFITQLLILLWVFSLPFGVELLIAVIGSGLMVTGLLLVPLQPPRMHPSADHHDVATLASLQSAKRLPWQAFWTGYQRGSRRQAWICLVPLLAVPAGMPTASYLWAFSGLILALMLSDRLSAIDAGARQLNGFSGTLAIPLTRHLASTLRFLLPTLSLSFALVLLSNRLPALQSAPSVLRWGIFAVLLLSVSLAVLLSFAVREAAKGRALAARLGVWLALFLALQLPMLLIMTPWLMLVLYRQGAAGGGLRARHLPIIPKSGAH